jgi:hypothetical protein
VSLHKSATKISSDSCLRIGKIKSEIMANHQSGQKSLDYAQDTQLFIIECGATSTLTALVLNMSNVREKEVII